MLNELKRMSKQFELYKRQTNIERIRAEAQMEALELIKDDYTEHYNKMYSTYKDNFYMQKAKEEIFQKIDDIFENTLISEDLIDRIDAQPVHPIRAERIKKKLCCFKRPGNKYPCNNTIFNVNLSNLCEEHLKRDKLLYAQAIIDLREDEDA